MDFSGIFAAYFGSPVLIPGPKVSSAMASVCAVVGCGPGMGGSAAIRFAKAGYKIAGMCRTAETFLPTEDGDCKAFDSGGIGIYWLHPFLIPFGSL